jgi:UDP-3-O-[3-hydroxymyristoyl] N-acetylglucosamine deacetylase
MTHVTLGRPVRLTGIGLHSGEPARATILPALRGQGIRFRRPDRGAATVAARWDAVIVSELCTRLCADGVEVSTVEHLMAALAGLGITDALVDLDGPEPPILDGSSAPFVEALRGAGLRPLGGRARAIEVLRPVEVRDGEAVARLEPAGRFACGCLTLDFAIDFPDAAIGRQHRRLTLRPGAFERELAAARTFCRRTDVEAMRSRGLALGGSLSNAVVVDGGRVLSPGGLRWSDEMVRHKMLDAVGDLALAGAPIHGRYVGLRSGHRLTNRLLRALFAEPAAWRIAGEEVPAGRRARPVALPAHA